MKPETFIVPSELQGNTAAWTALAIAGGAIVVLLTIYWPTTFSIYAIWKRSETFAHGFVILPAVLWLLWRDRERLATCSARPYYPALGALALVGLAWLTAQLANVSTASQFALLFMVELSVVTVVGLAMSRRMLFPLAFLAFAIPFGDFLLPWLIDLTADATTLLLKLSGVPVYREANHLQIPSGSWSVVEACGGLRYLIASLVAGSLYAYLRYSSFHRRLVFLAAALAVPLIANWLRAYAIVMLAHFTNNQLGVDVDHLIYGWIFFGVVMILLFWVGSRWEKDAAPASVVAIRPSVSVKRFQAQAAVPVLSAGLLCILVASVWPLLLRSLEAAGSSSPVLMRPLASSAGWQAANGKDADWHPRFVKPSAELSQQFVKDGVAAGVHIAYYRNQNANSKLVSTENMLVPSDDRVWRILNQGHETVSFQQATVRARTTVIGGKGQQLLVRQWYWVDGRYTGSLYLAAALLLRANLARRGDDSAAILMYTPVTGGESAARAILDGFTSDMAQTISRALEDARAKR